jgi:prepilin-type N-terminal cleavage/methylation domain-containing protein
MRAAPQALSQTRRLKAGFTFVEMLISMSIVVLFSTIILANQRRFESSLTTKSLAYEVALVFRQAQVFSLAVRGSGSSFEVAHGVHFDQSTPDAFFLYVDEDDNARYDSGTDTVIERFSLRSGSQIADLCVESASPRCALESLDVVYERPDPDANITSFDGVTRRTRHSDASVRIRSRYGVERVVRVTLPGQISVQN